MICISVTPSSRRLAAADLFNASRHCDVIELCLDGLRKLPDVGKLLKAVEKPVIVSCRRECDGGQWTGAEEDRIQLLRNAIVAGPAYVELELDIAGDIPPFGNTKRVISHTNLSSPLNQSAVDKVFEECWKARADIVKFTWRTDTLDDAWPLLAVATQNRELPVVGKGIGPAGLAFGLLARRHGSPWIYAALEGGMETFEGEVNVWQLQDEYCWSEINHQTRFVGIVGCDTAQNATTRILNATFREYDVPVRCLPLLPGRPDRLRKMLDVLKIRALLVNPKDAAEMTSLVDDLHHSVRDDGSLDVLTEKEGRWKARASLFDALEFAASHEGGGKKWAMGRTILVIGSGPLSVSIAARYSETNAAVSLAAPSDNAAIRAARAADVRHVPWSAIYSLMIEGIILADANVKYGTKRNELNFSVLRENMTVIDLMNYPAESAIADESRARGCRYISPSLIYASQLQTQFRYLTGKTISVEAFQRGLVE
jgi:3-dehydroquinate dehydratase / shikimate dehydrogenase